MKRTQVNLFVDVLAFAAFLFLLSTGLLLRYQLPAGSGGLQATGAGRGAGDRPVALLWNLTRHDWGAIHYWIAGFLIAVLAVHLILHWNWIVSVVGGRRSDTSGLRFGLGLSSVLALLLIALAPLVAPIERVSRDQLQQRQFTTKSADADAGKSEPRGSMTVAEVAAANDLTVEMLIDQLNLKAGVAPSEKIGSVLRRNGLRMSDLRRIIESPGTQRRQDEGFR